MATEAYRVYYRTEDITSDSTSSWALVNQDGDLSNINPSDNIQFMFEFCTIGMTCIPARIFKLIVTYEDDSTDSHYQLSAGFSNATSKTITWRFLEPFDGTVPTLKIELFDAETGTLLTTDTTLTSTNGNWSKTIDDGDTWGAYDSLDKENDTTYIRYTSTSVLTDGVRIKALLTQY